MNARAGAVGTDAATLAPDVWLSERIGVAAFTLPSGADPGLRPAVRPAFLQTKVVVPAPERLTAVIGAGYSLVETLVTLEMAIGGRPAPRRFARFATPADEEAIRRIAGSVFTQSRFHMDPHIPAQVVCRIKEDWAVSFFAGGRGTHMVVADTEGGVVGFLLLILRGGELIIDLVGVAAGCQGRGIGRAMLDFAARNISGPSRYVVGTQLHNVQSLSYYTGYGFRIVRASHSLHQHLS